MPPRGIHSVADVPVTAAVADVHIIGMMRAAAKTQMHLTGTFSLLRRDENDAPLIVRSITHGTISLNDFNLRDAVRKDRRKIRCGIRRNIIECKRGDAVDIDFRLIDICTADTEHLAVLIRRRHIKPRYLREDLREVAIAAILDLLCRDGICRDEILVHAVRLDNNVACLIRLDRRCRLRLRQERKAQSRRDRER